MAARIDRGDMRPRSAADRREAARRIDRAAAASEHRHVAIRIGSERRVERAVGQDVREVVTRDPPDRVEAAAEVEATRAVIDDAEHGRGRAGGPRRPRRRHEELIAPAREPREPADLRRHAREVTTHVDPVGATRGR